MRYETHHRGVKLTTSLTDIQTETKRKTQTHTKSGLTLSHGVFTITYVTKRTSYRGVKLIIQAEYKLSTKKHWRSIAGARFPNKGEGDFFNFKSNRVWFETYKPAIFFRLFLGVVNILTGCSHYVYMCHQYIDSNI